MARKIAVLDIHQKDSDKPITYIKRSAAELLVRRLLASWVVERQIIRYLAVRKAINPLSIRVTRAKPYIPEVLPAAELPGLTFKDPNPAHNYHKFVMAYLA